MYNQLTKYLYDVIYIRFDEQMITVRAVRKNCEFCCPAVVGITEHGHAILGDEVQVQKANGVGVQSIPCFDHPRIIFPDTLAVYSLVKYCIDQLFPKLLPRPQLSIFFHPQRQGFGHLSQVELDAFHQVGEYLQAKQTYVWMGENLLDADLLGTPSEVKGRLFDTEMNYTVIKLQKSFL